MNIFNQSRPRFDRRRFLQAMGLGTGSLFLPSLLRGAQADAEGPPPRILFFFAEHGTFYPNWRMRRPDSPQSEQAEYEFDLKDLPEDQFSEILRPLYPYRDEMIVLDGLALLSAMADPYGDGHAKGWCASLTGQFARETYDGVKSLASVASIDQKIKEHLRAQDSALTDLTSLEYGIANWGGTFHQLSYGTDTQGTAVKVPLEVEPKKALDALFGAKDDMNDPVRAARLGVVEQVRAQYEQMAPKLSGADRAKLESHRDLISDLHKRIETLQNLECTQPEIMDLPYAEWTGERFAYKRDSFVELVAAAFSCQVSRVATIFSWIPPMDMIGGTGDYHHDYAHQSGSDAPAEKQQVVTNAERVLAETVAKFAERLKQIPEGDGTVYDNTIIVWVSELANGGHGHNQWPAVLLGGGAKKFKGGRYLRFPETTPHPLTKDWNPGGFVGQPHQPLLTSLCQAMGMEVDSTGLKSIPCLAPDSTTVEVGLTGPMERLYG
ncbi:MAG TPA: DUF1552 domain-containing protein [Nannocystis sp.]|jgi:hypothetical protein